VTAPCTGCTHAQRRLRLSKPALHCLRFHAPAVLRCLDYRTRPAAIQAALDYLKRSSIK
jgi:hypothetical protein